MNSSTSPQPLVAVVVGSTRPSRICFDVATWACASLNLSGDCRYELLDLADIELPLLDEPVMASRNEYAHEHTRQWSRTVSKFDGFFFVFPQYNWGYPAVLKNALDYLYEEWRGKPASMMTYGSRGGGKAADQLAQVLNGLHMKVLGARVEAPIGAPDVTATGALLSPTKTFAPLSLPIASVAAAFDAAFNDARKAA